MVQITQVENFSHPIGGVFIEGTTTLDTCSLGTMKVLRLAVRERRHGSTERVFLAQCTGSFGDSP